MADLSNLTGLVSEPSGEIDTSVSSASNRSLRLAEKEKRKAEADPFGLAVKYLSQGECSRKQNRNVLQKQFRGLQFSNKKMFIYLFISFFSKYANNRIQTVRSFVYLYCRSRHQMLYHI